MTFGEVAYGMPRPSQIGPRTRSDVEIPQPQHPTTTTMNGLKLSTPENKHMLVKNLDLSLNCGGFWLLGSGEIFQ
jgi:hypothetical protein